MHGHSQGGTRVDGIVKMAYNGVMRNTTDADKFPAIYQILNLQNGKRYVGQAQNIGRRIRQHLCLRDAKSGKTRLYNDVLNYGWDAFEWSVLEAVDDLGWQNERERVWIEVLDSCNKQKGYNMYREPFTTRGWKCSDEVRAILSKNASKRTGERNPFFGKRHSLEAKQRTGAANAARIRTEEEKAKLRLIRATNGAGRPARPVDQISLDTGDIIHTWPTISEAGRALGIHSGDIVRCCQRSWARRKAKGFGWRYAARPAQGPAQAGLCQLHEAYGDGQWGCQQGEGREHREGHPQDGRG